MKVQPIMTSCPTNTFGVRSHCRVNKRLVGDFRRTAALSSRKSARFHISAEQIIEEITAYNRKNNSTGYDFHDPYDKEFIPYIVQASNELGQEAALNLARFVKRTENFDLNYFKEVVAEQFMLHPDTLNRWKYQDQFSPMKIGELCRSR